MKITEYCIFNLLHLLVCVKRRLSRNVGGACGEPVGDMARVLRFFCGGEAGAMYDLSGRRIVNRQLSTVNSIKKGLYIKDGQKVLVK